jgi:hypothetical protein
MRTQKPTDPEQAPVITIDLSQWATVTQYAREKDANPNTIAQRVRRTLNKTTLKPLELWHIPELGITLIRRNG